MKFCNPHLAQLRAAIDARGLTHLVAKDGQAAAENMQAEIQGTADGSNYDPLMNAHWMIMNRALELGGLYLMTVKEDGSHYCPLCELNANTPEASPIIDYATNWIEGCTDSVLAHCIENKLTTPLQ